MPELETVTTADLIAEIHSRFDACVIVAMEKRTDRETESTYWRKGDVFTAIGLHETAVHRLKRGGWDVPLEKE